MSESKVSTDAILVHFIHQGVAGRDYHLSEGATLADLLRLSGVSAINQALFIDGVPQEQAMRLSDGVVVTMRPRPADAAGDEPWRACISAFRDEDLFREYSEAINENRRGSEPGEDPAT